MLSFGASFSALTAAVILVTAAVVGCSTADTTGACVSSDEGNTFCFEDREDFACSGAFKANASCSSVGYPYFCTAEDMKASGARQTYFVERYLDNAACNPSGSGGTGSSSGGSSGTSGSSTGAVYVQFYADSAKYNQDTYVIRGIEFEGRTQSASSTKGACEDRIALQGSVLEGSPSPRVHFVINVRSYNSLDTAFGAEYTDLKGYATYSMADFKPGCNTLEVVDGGGSYVVTLQLSQ